MDILRLSGRKRCALLMRKGRTWKGRTMIIRWLPGAPQHPLVHPSRKAWYIGTVASAKLHKSAVVRNRMRRRCREALRTAVKDRPGLPVVQLLILPRSASLKAPFADIRRDVSLFLSALSSSA